MRTCSLTLLSLSSLLVASAAAADPATTSNVSTGNVSITLHGFLDTTFFWQDQNFVFGNGQNAEFPVPAASGTHNDLSGGDLRNTRLWIDINGGALGGSGWTAGAHIEGDFFGGFNGTGPYSSQQESPRLRQGFITLNDADSGTSWKLGQQWSLLFQTDNTPESYAHIAFPLGFGSGIIGWRFPGAVWSQELNRSGGDWRLDVGAFSGSWNGPGSNVNYDTAGNADFNPQLEARLHVDTGSLLWYVAGHYSHESLGGVGGAAPTPVASSITSYAYEGGARWQSGAWVVHANLYVGKGLGEDFGALAQFGAISEWGGFVQAGYKFTPNWALYGLYATVRPNQGNVVTWVAPKPATTAYLRNQQLGADLLYSEDAWGLGFEWLHAIARTTNDPTGTVTQATVGDQLSVSGIFRF